MFLLLGEYKMASCKISFCVLCIGAISMTSWAVTQGNTETDKLACEIENSVAAANAAFTVSKDCVSIESYAKFIRIGKWNEGWTGSNGKMGVRKVKGKIWTEAIQKALDEHLTVKIPYSSKPYYIDAPLI